MGMLNCKAFMLLVNATEEETKEIFDKENARVYGSKYMGDWSTPIDSDRGYILARDMVRSGTHKWLIPDPTKPGRKRVNRPELSGVRPHVTIMLDENTIKRMREKYPNIPRGDVLENAFWDMEAQKNDTE